jgi:pimeloyl-ACP methyl ester carboxylesterase
MITQDKLSTPTQFYTWLHGESYNCAYEVQNPNLQTTPLVLIHPIGVGLSRKFWQRFSDGCNWSIYNPDLLGCGESDMPDVAYTPEFHAEQLQYFIENIVQKPVILVVQGALLPVAIALTEKAPNLIAGMVLSGPPTFALISRDIPKWQQKLAWTIFSSPFGNLFYRYARKEKFLRNFSTRKLFASPDAVDAQWLDTLHVGSENMASRYAVFSFLAGFWRKDYRSNIAAIDKPVLIVMGEFASSIGKEGKEETLDDRLKGYTTYFKNSRIVKMPGRNVLPYESTSEFIKAMSSFVDKVSTGLSV